MSMRRRIPAILSLALALGAFSWGRVSLCAMSGPEGAPGPCRCDHPEPSGCCARDARAEGPVLRRPPCCVESTWCASIPLAFATGDPVAAESAARTGTWIAFP